MSDMDLDSLRKFVEDTQARDWHELDQQIRRAINGTWSIEAGSTAQRIVSAARLVGPTDPGETPWRLYSGGVYQAVLTAGGVDFTPLPDGEVQRCDRLMAEYGPVGGDAVRAYAATVEAIRDEGETAWIRNDQ